MLYLNPRKLLSFTCFLISFLFIILACQKDKLGDLKNEIKDKLKEGNAQGAISLIESSPYASIRDPEFALLSSEAYCSLGCLSSSSFETLFSQDPVTDIFSGKTLADLSSFVDDYEPQKEKNFLLCISSLFRSRHDATGTPLVDFSDDLKENLVRELSLRTLYFVFQKKKFLDFLRVFPYLFDTEPNKVALNLLVPIVEQTRDTHYDLLEQAYFFGHPVLEDVAVLIEEENFEILNRGESYSFKWNSEYQEMYYALAMKRFSETPSGESWAVDKPFLEKVIAGIRSSSPYFLKSILEDEFEGLTSQQKLSFIKESLSRYRSKLEASGSTEESLKKGLEDMIRSL